MPRNSAGQYTLPNGSVAVPGSIIYAATHNVPIQDIAFDLNVARPIGAGGTGATTAAAARSNLGVPLAQTHPEDTTPNSAMIVGAFGLGATARLSSDWGFWPAGVTAFYRTSTANVAGAPDGNSQWGAVHVSVAAGNTRSWDLAVKANSKDSAPDVRVRVDDSTGPGPWYRVSMQGGPINGTPIGTTTPAAGAFTNLSATGTLSVGGGMTAASINDTPIGGSTPRAGSFTSLSAANNATIAGNLTVSGQTNATAGLTVSGGATIAGAVSISGGMTAASINDTPIGGGTPRAGSFTSLSAATSLSVGTNATITNTCTAAQFSGGGGAVTGLNAANIATGTLATARLGTAASDRDWVRSRWLDFAATGGLGCLAYLQDTVDRTTNYLTTRAGADLRPANADGSGAGTTAPDGKWTCLGRCETGGSTAKRTTLWIRTS